MLARYFLAARCAIRGLLKWEILAPFYTSLNSLRSLCDWKLLYRGKLSISLKNIFLSYVNRADEVRTLCLTYQKRFHVIRLR